MLESMVQQFKAFYTFEGLSFKMVLLAIALALVFCAIWLIIYRLWHFNKAWWVVIFLFGGFITWTAIAFIQIPLQQWTQDLLVNRLGPAGFSRWLLLTGIPIILFSGLVQEAAKLLPVIAIWGTRARQIEPLTGLWAGALSGAAFGIFEAIWVHNSIFAAGWTWEAVSISGATALLGFIERFFTIGFHIAVSALAGYGWAKGMKWQFYLIAAGLHTVSNYSVVLYSKQLLSINQVELYIAGIAIATTIFAFLAMRSTAQTPSEPALEEESDSSMETPDTFSSDE
jgi:RsiW-degrading membrane proteinase PrsW (M82 family)